MVTAINNPVLVLNKGWSAINATTVREAIKGVVADKAFVVSETFEKHDRHSWFEQPVREGDPFIQSVNQTIRAPEVIVNRHEGMPKQEVKWSRRNLWKRDQYRCQYCGKRPVNDDITVDHVIPRSRKSMLPPGIMMSSFENCVLSCVKCNKLKDNRTPEQAGMPLQRMRVKNGILVPEFYRRPKTPVWSPIFAVQRHANLPAFWSKFVDHMISELYWNVELDDD